MQNILRAALLTIAITITGGALAEPKTGALSLTVFYDFSFNGLKVAEVADTLTIDDNGEYQINRTAAAIGLAKILYGDIISNSAGRITDYGLQMSVYHQRRKSGSRPPQSAKYDGETLRLMRGEESKTAETAAPLYDYLTIIYSHYVAGKILTGAVRQTDGWRIRDYIYEVGTQETITTPMGEIKVIPVSYKSDRGPRIFWLAPAMGFLPVRSIVEDKGSKFETIMTPRPEAK